MISSRTILSITILLFCSLIRADAGALEIRQVVSDLTKAEIVMSFSDEQLPLSKSLGITGAHVAKAEVQKGSNGWLVFVTLTNQGAAKFANATKIALGERLAVIVNSEVLTAPKVQEVLTGGKFVISGDFTETEARRLAKDLSGKKPN